MSGILLAKYVLIDELWPLFVAITSLCFLLALKWLKVPQKYSANWVFGFLTAIAFGSLGMLSFSRAEQALGGDNFYTISENDWLIGMVNDEPSVGEKWVSFELLVQQVHGAGSLTKETPVLLNLIADSNSNKLEYGSMVALHKLPQPISDPQNPGQFDYRQYLLSKGISYQVYAKPKDWKYLNCNRGNNFMSLSYKTREALHGSLISAGLAGNELGVVSALVLGQKDYLNSDLKKAYSGAGAMHVLAVSGLHVGIIYLILNFVLSFMNRGKHLKVLRALLLLMLLWAYAFITGLGPSVLRATTMFSFVVIGTALNRTPNIYNTLAASALLLLLINPMLLFNVGFQLSYVAVFGIVYLQPLIYNWFYVKNKMLDYIWQITAVSIAAQIATLPIVVYNFHQIPIYGLLSNLIVIPAAAIILIGALMIFVFSFSATLSSGIGYLLYWIVKGTNYTVFQIDALPGSKMSGLFITAIMAFLLYLFIVGVIEGLRRRHFKLLLIASAIFLVFTGLDFKEDVLQAGNSKFCVYSNYQVLTIDCIQGHDHVLITGSEVQTERLDRVAGGHWSQLDLKDVVPIEATVPYTDPTLNFQQKNGFIQFQNLTCLVVDSNLNCLPTVPLDVLIVENWKKFKELEPKLEFDQLVIGNGVKPWEIGDLREQNTHQLRSGAFVVHLNHDILKQSDHGS